MLIKVNALLKKDDVVRIFKVKLMHCLIKILEISDCNYQIQYLSSFRTLSGH